MSPGEIIAAVYAQVQPQLPPGIVSALTFRPAALLDKSEVQRWQGLVFGKQAHKIWYAKGGFYSVRVGPDPSFPRSVGDTGFGFYPDQKPCGSGKHAAAMWDIAQGFRATHPGSRHGQRGGKCFGFGFDYTGSTPLGFPVERAADDLAELIIHTFPTINALVV